MSELKKMAAIAAVQVETIVSDMFSGNYPDNEVLLGEGLFGDNKVQIQLYVTQESTRFMDEYGSRPYGRERFIDWSKAIPTCPGAYLWREIGETQPNKALAYVTKDIEGRVSVCFDKIANEYCDIHDVAKREWLKIPQ